MKPAHLAAALAMGASALAMAAPAQAEDVKIGVLLGYTGPIESLTPGMADSAELAMKEVNDAGGVLGGDMLVPVRADSTCIDAAAASAAAERLVTAEGVKAIMGADCSGVTIATLNNVAMPNGIVMISPSATSPALSSIEDGGFFFRTAPSDARQGAVLAEVLTDKGVTEIAVTYTNNDYGKGLADSFQAAFEEKGGKVLLSAAHEDGKADYSAEVGALSATGAEYLAVFGYADQGGVGIIRASVDSGAFEKFVLGDGMFAESLIEAIGDDLNGTIGSVPWSEGEGADAFVSAAEAAGVDPDGSFRRESYDAAALIALAMQAAGSTDPKVFKDKVMDVANAPGEKILPGELAKALQILKDGGDVDYVGATNVELIGPGEAAGTYREYEVKDGAYETVGFR
ncbi:ABC transporter substrate-binding protein [Albimonas sp. CAU 1670]|uniref:ABC transporter substrate-binding protein n=1 Tax=Albimonas sp. CAU 1670 TaxID=3032599 RepID=UPI0023D9ADE7|nr:ABC transporter substrate-binding protein [Albimonas sp. CAU 1670]MDF2232561.1 ABC transporter substrate-binding protein [Albimonas sp. CAU 1670]